MKRFHRLTLARLRRDAMNRFHRGTTARLRRDAVIEPAMAGHPSHPGRP